MAQTMMQPGIAATRLAFTTSPPTVVELPETTAYLFDIPLVSSADEQNGFYAAMSDGSGWPGAALFKSSDGGTTFASVASTSTPAVMGTALSALGMFYGGNVFDEVNFVRILTTGGELTSASMLAVLNGTNEAILGDEVIQFRDAELVDVDTYELSGLLRGRLGTEWAMGAHVSGERFALLPLLRVPSARAELNQSRQYKPVTFGATVADATAQTFANTGVALRPYAPVHLGGGTDDAGDVALTATRRTRLDGGWVDFVDVPLGETTERYVFQIWDASYIQCARVIETTTPSATYSAADQVADFGDEQAHIYFTVGQIGSIGIGIQARGVATGSGPNDDLPLAPITPYANSPATTGGGGSVDSVLDWATSSGAIVSPLPRGQIWVGEFTVGATPPTSGSVSWAEYGAAPAPRRARLATDAAATNVLAEAYTGLGQFQFGSSTPVPLSAGTTYYLWIQSGVTPDGVVTGAGDCSMIALLNHTP
jgi:hypothetical protein